MRGVKLLYLAFAVAIWHLTGTGYLGVPVSKLWFVSLIGLTLGFIFGCIESKTTYHADYIKAIWCFSWDSMLVFILCLMVMIWKMDQIGPAAVALPFATSAAFLFFGWPRYLQKE
jgi:hypothetical protein